MGLTVYNDMKVLGNEKVKNLKTDGQLKKLYALKNLPVR